MNRERNKQYRATESKLENILSALLKNKHITKVTVKEICTIGNINRSTFYYHYLDVYDLAEKTFRKTARCK